MNRKLTALLIAITLITFTGGTLWAQNMAKVMGKCTDLEGKPIVGATVEVLSNDTGQKYNLKTDKKGEYFSIGVMPGAYKFSLIQDGKVLYYFNNVSVNLASEDGIRV